MSSRARSPIIAIVIASACSGANQATRKVSADENAIRSARIEQNAEIAAGDVDRAAQLWTEDVEIRRGLGQLIVGRDGYRQLVTPKGNRDSALVYQRNPTSIVVSEKWPLAFETGKWGGHLGSVAGKAVIEGNYSAQWVKRGSRWLIRGELFVALTCAGTGCAYSAAL